MARTRKRQLGAGGGKILPRVQIPFFARDYATVALNLRHPMLPAPGRAGHIIAMRLTLHRTAEPLRQGQAVSHEPARYSDLPMSLLSKRNQAHHYRGSSILNKPQHTGFRRYSIFINLHQVGLNSFHRHDRRPGVFANYCLIHISATKMAPVKISPAPSFIKRGAFCQRFLEGSSLWQRRSGGISSGDMRFGNS